MTSSASASSAAEMKYLPPEISQSSPSRRAVVLTAWLLDPESGSVRQNAIFTVPAAMPGSQRCLISGEPWAARMDPQMAGEITVSSSGIPCAASSSMTTASSDRPAPPPPYSSGRCTPSMPDAPSSAHSSSTLSPARDFSRK